MPRRVSCSCFNPRLRTGGDAIRAGITLSQTQFQSTPPHGRRRSAGPAADPGHGFQSTPPHGRRLRLCGRRIGERPSFNPRLRTGGDMGDEAWSRAEFNVSIHASAREATSYGVGAEWGEVQVSIHASAREATLVTGGHTMSRISFNPRLRTGGDINGVGLQVLQGQFQSTPPHGRRPPSAMASETKSLFQSTPPHGRRRGTGWLPGVYIPGFNPRLRTGGDMYGDLCCMSCPEFQSTPPHGRRRSFPAW